MRYVHLFFVLVLTWLASCAGNIAADDVSVQPNVIFILTDDLGWGDLGCFHQNGSTHNKRHKTPRLDQMASEGMQLRAHYCPAPVCAPSRCSLLTGVHQGHAKVRDNQFDKALPANHTLASMMKSSGYRTAIIGKYGLPGHGGSCPDEWEAYPTKRGFDEFFGYVRHVDGHIHYPNDTWELGDSDSHKKPKRVFWNDREVSHELSKCYTTDLFTARSKRWIVDHKKNYGEKPFFLYLAYDTPHAALQLPSVEYPDGVGVDSGVQWLDETDRMINTAIGEIDSYRHPDYVGEGWSDLEERFATMVRRIDDSVADLLATLKDLGIDDNTLVVFTSDNGPHHESYIAGVNYNPTSFQSYGPFDGTKRDVWEGGIRMPTLAWWPGKIPAGSVSNQASQFHDWMPTLAEAAGSVAPARSDGVSLLPTLTEKGIQLPGTVYVEYFQPGKTRDYEDFDDSHKGRKRGQMQVIMMDGYKGVRCGIESHQDDFEIYDIAKDLNEEFNLSNKSQSFNLLQRRMKDKVLRSRVRNISARRPYDNEPVPSLKDASFSEEIHWTCYPGAFAYVPQVSPLQAGSSGTTQDMSVNVERGAVAFRKLVNIPETGKYRIDLRTPTKAFVRLHDAGVLDADFNYKAGTRVSRRIHLEAGLHPVLITCLTDDDGKAEATLDIVRQHK